MCHNDNGLVKSIYIVLTIFIFFVSCASKDRPLNVLFPNEGKDALEYKIVDSSENSRPLWLMKPQESNGDASSNNYYFSYGTGPKVSQEIACNLLKAFSKDEIIWEIVNFAKSGESKQVQNAIEDTGYKIIHKNFNRAKIIKTYWEKRMYPPLIGDLKEVPGYTCAYLIEVPRQEVLKSYSILRAIIAKKFNQGIDQDKGILWEREYFYMRMKTY